MCWSQSVCLSEGHFNHTLRRLTCICAAERWTCVRRSTMRWSWRSGGRGSLLSPAGSITAASLWLWGQLTRRTRRFLKSEGERERRGYDWYSPPPPSPLQSCDLRVKMFRASLPNVLKHIKTIFRLTKTNLIRIQHVGTFLIIFCALMHSASLHQLHCRHTDAATVSWQKRSLSLSVWN